MGASKRLIAGAFALASSVAALHYGPATEQPNETTVLPELNVTNTRIETMDKLSSALSVSRSFMEESPFSLIGTPEQLIDDLVARREKWGFSFIIVGANDIEPFAPVVAALAGK